MRRDGRDAAGVKDRAVPPPVTAAPGENDDVEDLARRSRGDGEIDVAQPGREIGDEQRGAGGAGERPNRISEPEVGRRTKSSAAPAAYIPTRKKPNGRTRSCRCSRSTRSDDIANNPQIKNFGEKAAQNSGSTSGADGEQRRSPRRSRSRKGRGQSGLAERQRLIGGVVIAVSIRTGRWDETKSIRSEPRTRRRLQGDHPDRGVRFEQTAKMAAAIEPPRLPMPPTTTR